MMLDLVLVSGSRVFHTSASKHRRKSQHYRGHKKSLFYFTVFYASRKSPTVNDIVSVSQKGNYPWLRLLSVLLSPW